MSIIAAVVEAPEEVAHSPAVALVAVLEWALAGARTAAVLELAVSAALLLAVFRPLAYWRYLAL